jgi:hypothetical protein
VDSKSRLIAVKTAKNADWVGLIQREVAILPTLHYPRFLKLRRSESSGRK